MKNAESRIPSTDEETSAGTKARFTCEVIVPDHGNWTPHRHWENATGAVTTKQDDAVRKSGGSLT